MTSTNHGAPTGVASDARESLYKLLKMVRERKEGKKGWEGVYEEIAKRKEKVMRKRGNKGKEKPRIVNWGVF